MAQNIHRKPPISPREWAVAGCGSATLAFTAWGLGGVVNWTLHTMLLGGILTLFFAICPLPLKFNGRDHRHGNWVNLRRLLLTPIFWFGACFLIYITIQAFNPAAEVVRNEQGWWVEAIDPPLANWLPTSVRSGYEPMNAFRMIEVFAASFSLCWGLWVGLSRRVTTQLVLWVFVLSGVSMGMVAILQHFTKAEAVLWMLPSSNKNFWGTFFYRNHGVGYLNIVLFIISLMFFYYARNSRLEGRNGGPHFILFAFFALTITSIFLALSRGGIVFGGLITLSFLVLVCLQAIIGIQGFKSFLGIFSILLMLLLGAFSLIRYIDIEAIQKRFGNIEKSIEEADQDARTFSTRATWDMFQDRLIWGWGAGSFRYIFPMYQKAYPQIFYGRYDRKKGWVDRQMYRYAHNDIVQFLAEYGALGCGLLLAFFTSFLVTIFRAIRTSPFLVIMLLVGLFSAFAHAFVDFIFSSPAYWCAIIGILSATGKLLSLERRRLL